MEGLGEYFQKHILLQKEKYQWLLKPLAELNLHVQRIANFGCAEGQETLTLMCMLGASEAVGIDKDEQSIRNARSTLETIQDIIWARGVVPSDAPGFLKSPRLEEVVKFYSVDIAKETSSLPPNHYDFAFCNFVLNHIWLNQGGPDETQTAIREMARVVRPGGVIAACEPTWRIGKQTFELDFDPLFQRAGLKRIHTEQISFEGGHDTEYLYLKESII